MKSRHYFERHQLFFYSAFAIMTLVTVYPLFFTGIACSDDLQNFLTGRWGNVMKNASESAVIAGRFYYYLVKPLNILPYMIDNMFVTKLFQVVPLVICFVLFARVIYVVTRSTEISLAFYLFFLVFSQVSGFTSLFVTYPFYFTFSFSLLLGSFLLLVRHTREKDKMARVYSAILYGIGLLFYETYILYLPVYLLAVFYMERNEGGTQKIRWLHTFKTMMPFLVIVAAYLVVYLVFRVVHPSQYDGTSIDPAMLTFKSFFGVLWSLSSSAFPLSVYEASHGLFYDQSELVHGYSPVVLGQIIDARPEWLVKGLLVAITGYLLFSRMPAVRFRTLVMVFLFSVFLVFMPHIPLAITPKYIFYVKYGMNGYVTTFFSLFGVLLFLVFLSGYLMQLASVNRYLKISVAAGMTLVLFVCSVITDFSNSQITADIRRANLQRQVMDELIKNDVFYPIPREAVILGKELYDNPFHSAQNLYTPPFNWESYINIQTGYWFEHFLRNDNDNETAWKSNPGNTWYFVVSQARKSDDVTVVIARISPPANGDSTLRYISDSASVLYFSPYKTFSCAFSLIPEVMGNYQPVSIQSYRDTLWRRQRIEVAIANEAKNIPATFFTIRGRSIDLRSVRISNVVMPELHVVNLPKNAGNGKRK